MASVGCQPDRNTVSLCYGLLDAVHGKALQSSLESFKWNKEMQGGEGKENLVSGPNHQCFTHGIEAQMRRNLQIWYQNQPKFVVSVSGLVVYMKNLIWVSEDHAEFILKNSFQTVSLVYPDHDLGALEKSLNLFLKTFHENIEIQAAAIQEKFQNPAVETEVDLGDGFVFKLHEDGIWLECS